MLSKHKSLNQCRFNVGPPSKGTDICTPSVSHVISWSVPPCGIQLGRIFDPCGLHCLVRKHPLTFPAGGGGGVRTCLQLIVMTTRDSSSLGAFLSWRKSTHKWTFYHFESKILPCTILCVIVKWFTMQCTHMPGDALGTDIFSCAGWLWCSG